MNGNSWVCVQQQYKLSSLKQLNFISYDIAHEKNRLIWKMPIELLSSKGRILRLTETRVLILINVLFFNLATNGPWHSAHKCHSSLRIWQSVARNPPGRPKYSVVHLTILLLPSQNIRLGTLCHLIGYSSSRVTIRWWWMLGSSSSLFCSRNRCDFGACVNAWKILMSIRSRCVGAHAPLQNPWPAQQLVYEWNGNLRRFLWFSRSDSLRNQDREPSAA